MDSQSWKGLGKGGEETESSGSQVGDQQTSVKRLREGSEVHIQRVRWQQHLWLCPTDTDSPSEMQYSTGQASKIAGLGIASENVSLHETMMNDFENWRSKQLRESQGQTKEYEGHDQAGTSGHAPAFGIEELVIEDMELAQHNPKFEAERTDHPDKPRLEAPSLSDNQLSQAMLPQNIEKIPQQSGADASGKHSELTSDQELARQILRQCNDFADRLDRLKTTFPGVAIYATISNKFDELHRKYINREEENGSMVTVHVLKGYIYNLVYELTKVRKIMTSNQTFFKGVDIAKKLLGEEFVAQTLGGMLRDKQIDERLHQYILKAIGDRLKVKSVVGDLLAEALNDELSTKTRALCVETIGKLEGGSADKSITDFLLTKLPELHPEVGKAAVTVLGVQKDKSITDRLLTKFPELHLEVGKAAVTVLGVQKDKSITDRLLTKLPELPPEIGREAVLALGRQGDKSITDFLLTKLPEFPPEIGKAAVVVLGWQKDKSIKDHLLTKILEMNPEVGKTAVGLIGRQGNKSMIDFLLTKLPEMHPEVGKATINAIIRKNDKSIKGRLVKMLPGLHPEVGKAAVNFISTQSNKLIKSHLIKMLPELHPEVGKAAVDFISTQSNKSIKSRLVKMLPGLHPEVGKAVITLLGERGQ